MKIMLSFEVESLEQMRKLHEAYVKIVNPEKKQDQLKMEEE